MDEYKNHVRTQVRGKEVQKLGIGVELSAEQQRLLGF